MKSNSELANSWNIKQNSEEENHETDSEENLNETNTEETYNSNKSCTKYDYVFNYVVHFNLFNQIYRTFNFSFS